MTKKDKKRIAELNAMAEKAYDNQQWDKMVELCNDMLRIDSNNVLAYNNRGIAYNRKGEHDNAISDYTQAIKLKPDVAQAYSNRGYAYNNKGEYDNAIRDCTQAIKLKPDYANAYNNRGIAYHDKEEFDDAISDYTQAIKINPDHASAYTNRGIAYHDKGEYDNAISDYAQAIRLEPNKVNAYTNIAITYRDKGEYEKAIEYCEKGISLCKKNKDIDRLEDLSTLSGALQIESEVKNKEASSKPLAELKQHYSEKQAENQELKVKRNDALSELKKFAWLYGLALFIFIWQPNNAYFMLPFLTGITLLLAPMWWEAHIANNEEKLSANKLTDLEGEIAKKEHGIYKDVSLSQHRYRTELEKPTPSFYTSTIPPNMDAE